MEKVTDKILIGLAIVAILVAMFGTVAVLQRVSAPAVSPITATETGVVKVYVPPAPFSSQGTVSVMVVNPESSPGLG